MCFANDEKATYVAGYNNALRELIHMEWAFKETIKGDIHE